MTSYGADPSGKADATTAFARAIDAAEKRGDGTLYVPPGRYVLDDPKAAVCELCIRRPIRDGLTIVDSVVGVLKVAPAVSARVLAVRGSSIEHPVACPHPGRVRGLHGLRCGSPVPGPRR